MDFKVLVLVHMPNGSLKCWFYNANRCLDLHQRLSTTVDVASALEYLHHGPKFAIIHCDLKPSNVLLGEDMTAHVNDFGISKLFEEAEALIRTKTLATIGYTSPEYALDGKVLTSGDVYSYRVLLLKMLTWKKPTDDTFNEGMTLKDWVAEALRKTDDVFEVVVDPRLVPSDDEHKFFYIK